MFGDGLGWERRLGKDADISFLSLLLFTREYERLYFRAYVTCPYLPDCRNPSCEFRHPGDGMLTPYERCVWYQEERERVESEERERKREVRERSEGTEQYRSGREVEREESDQRERRGMYRDSGDPRHMRRDWEDASRGFSRGPPPGVSSRSVGHYHDAYDSRDLRDQNDSGDRYGYDEGARYRDNHDRHQHSDQWPHGSHRASPERRGGGTGTRNSYGSERERGHIYDSARYPRIDGGISDHGRGSGNASGSGSGVGSAGGLCKSNDRTGHLPSVRDAFAHEGHNAARGGGVQGPEVADEENRSCEPTRSSRSFGIPIQHEAQLSSHTRDAANGFAHPLSPTALSGPSISPPRSLVSPLNLRPQYRNSSRPPALPNVEESRQLRRGAPLHVPAEYSPTQDPASTYPPLPADFQLNLPDEQAVVCRPLLDNTPPPAPELSSLPCFSPPAHVMHSSPAPEWKPECCEDDWVTKARQFLLDPDAWREYQVWSLAQGGDDALAFKLLRDMILSPNVGLSEFDLSRVFETTAALPAESYENDIAFLRACDIPQSKLCPNGAPGIARELSPRHLSSLDRLGSQVDNTMTMTPVCNGEAESMDIVCYSEQKA